MTLTTEIERFGRDHATPEAVAAFFSGIGPDASLDAVSTVLQTAGYNITRSDLDAASSPTNALSDDDLDNISGGICSAEGGGMADDWKLRIESNNQNVLNHIRKIYGLDTK